MTLVSATPSQGTCTAAVSCALRSLASTAMATVAIVVTADAAGTITYPVSVAANENDPVPANDTATATTTVNPVGAIALTIDRATTRFDEEDARKNRMKFRGQINLGTPFDPPADVVVDIDSSSLGLPNKIDAVTIPAAAFVSDGNGNFVTQIFVASQQPLGEPLRIGVTMPRSGTGRFNVDTRSVETDASAAIDVTLIIQVGARTGQDTVLEEVKKPDERLRFPL